MLEYGGRMFLEQLGSNALDISNQFDKHVGILIKYRKLFSFCFDLIKEFLSIMHISSIAEQLVVVFLIIIIITVV